VQIFHQYGLKPTFNESLCEWSQDLYSLVMVLSKTETTTEVKEQAERCLSTLFDVTITEHYGSFTRTEFGGKQNFKKMPNFAIPLVILTWNRVLQEYFLKTQNTHSSAYEIIVSKRKRTQLHYMTICFCQVMILRSTK